LKYDERIISHLTVRKMGATQNDFMRKVLEEQAMYWRSLMIYDNPTDSTSGCYKALEEMVDYLLEMHAVHKPTMFLHTHTTIVRNKAAEMVSSRQFESVEQVIKLALARAVTRGAVEVFAWLTAAGASVEDVVIEDNRGYDGEPYSMLSLAAFRGQLGSVAALLDAGASVNRAQPGNPALWWAAYAGNVAICKLLLDSGAKVDENDGDVDGTPLMAACKHGSIDIATMFLEAGADVNVVVDKGFCALLNAIRPFHFELIILLLNAGAKLDVSDEGGTALSQALRMPVYNIHRLLEALLNAGVPVSLDGAAGSRSLASVAAIKRLLQAGAPPLRTRHTGGWATVTCAAIKLKGTRALCLMLAAGESMYRQPADTGQYWSW
jgi:ankyrin repeat protein